jgi:UDP-N-acetylmuramoyl-tripeptide--D-alanyl-D-alanine ligase
MLQLEGYQTARFLRWSAVKQERWARTDRVVLALVAGVAPLLWATTGAWLARGATFGQAKKPLVLTARAKRLLAGQVLVGLLVAAGPAALLALRGRRELALPALQVGASGVSLAVPLVTAAANLLLWPVEEAFRRYYLRDARRTLREYAPTVVAVAGSYGKTSTKEFLATILAARWSVLRPPGSHNTPMGLSRVIREQLEPGHELFVAELGDYVPGDIRFLCDLVRPKIGVLTTIGPEHLERFKSIERVARTKEELIEALPTDGVAVINQDDPLVRAIGDRAEARGLRVVRYGLMPSGQRRASCHPERSEGSRSPAGQPGTGILRCAQDDEPFHNDEPVQRDGPLADAVPSHREQPANGASTVLARDVRTTRAGLVFTVEAEGRGEARFEVGVLGRHNVMNVLAATAAALELGMSLPEIAAAARSIAPVEHRLQPIQGAGGVLVIDDAFNSNPRGAAEALEVLAELEANRRVLVTPGMIELAEREFAENHAFGRKAADVCDEVILVGPERAVPIQAGLREAGFPESRTHVVRDLAEATARLRKLLRNGDVVLFENDLPDTYDGGEAPERRLAAGHTRTADSPAADARSSRGAGNHTRSASPVGAGLARPAPAPPAGTPARLVMDRAATGGASPAPTAETKARERDGGLGGSLTFARVDGLRIAYRESGQDTGRAPVVVLHGWGASSAAISSIQRCLEGEYRVISPDLPGFGASDPPPDAWDSAAYAGLVRAFLAERGIERATFIGHSRGGAISIVLAATRPELVERLVLVDSAGIRPRRGPAYRARVAAFKAGRRIVAMPLLRDRRDVQEWFGRRFGSVDYRQAGALRGTLVRVVNEDLRPLLPRIGAPTLLIWGERDEETPLSDGQFMERQIPDAGLVVFPAAGHFAYADDPRRFCRVVSYFLKS